MTTNGSSANSILSVPTSVPLTRSGSTLGSASSDAERKKRSRILLRDYYGLASAGKGGDALDIDLPQNFNAELYFSTLSKAASLPELLQRENELLMEIRELDGERQSLVYNHHHELIEASDTIRKMKSRALALDASLDSLKASFQSISQLSDALVPSSSNSLDCSTPRGPVFTHTPVTPTQANSTRRAALPTLDENVSTSLSYRGRSGSATLTEPSAPIESATPFDPLIHLPPLLALPTLLRALLSPTAANLSDPANRQDPAARAKGLWGSWEPALRALEDAGVEGVGEISTACRQALRNGRRASIGTR